MAKVKILLEKGEDQLDADHALQKALELHTSGEIHQGELFDDSAMVHTAQRMEEIHSRIYAEMIREINELLDEEYSDGNQ